MKVTFVNVAITVEAEDAREAYQVLADLFDHAADVVAWESSEYATDDDSEIRDVEEILP